SRRLGQITRIIALPGRPHPACQRLLRARLALARVVVLFVLVVVLEPVCVVVVGIGVFGFVGAVPAFQALGDAELSCFLRTRRTYSCFGRAARYRDHAFLTGGQIGQLPHDRPDTDTGVFGQLACGRVVQTG